MQQATRVSEQCYSEKIILFIAKTQFFLILKGTKSSPPIFYQAYKLGQSSSKLYEVPLICCPKCPNCPNKKTIRQKGQLIILKGFSKLI